MLEYEYMNPNFDIEKNPCFNDINGLKDISNYIDFGIAYTIHKQIPNIALESEKDYAKVILKEYMKGNPSMFTKDYGIRKNINKIGYEKIKSLLLKILIEKGKVNRRILHRLNPQDFNDECADYITEITYCGQLDKEENQNWLKNNMAIFIDIYVDECYRSKPEDKTQREELCYGNSVTTRALEQLNLEMSLNRIKK